MFKGLKPPSNLLQLPHLGLCTGSVCFEPPPANRLSQPKFCRVLLFHREEFRCSISVWSLTLLLLMVFNLSFPSRSTIDQRQKHLRGLEIILSNKVTQKEAVRKLRCCTVYLKQRIFKGNSSPNFLASPCTRTGFP